MARSSSYSWMPGWLRKFMNLDDDLPAYGPSSYSAQDDYAPPARQTFTAYTPPAPAPRYTPSAPPATGDEQTRRFTPTYASPPPPAAGSPAAARGVAAAAYPAPPRTLGPTGTVQPDGTVSPGGNVPSLDTQGYVQPVGYLLRSYARGALPPQGLEQFTREFRATLTDVWNFYSYWTRFQTDELVRIGREAMDAVADTVPPSAEAGTTSVRRIKVTVGNGEKKVDRVATTTTVDPPPEPTPAAPPAPPAPTARFSATVTADDAAVPPEGRDISSEFAARMAGTAAEVRSDIAEDTAPIADDVAADAGRAAAKLEAGAASAAQGAADAIEGAGDMTRAAAESAAETVDEAAKDVADKLKDGDRNDRT